MTYVIKLHTKRASTVVNYYSNYSRERDLLYSVPFMHEYNEKK